MELTQSQAYGFVHLRTFRDDIYRLSDDGMELRGRRTGSTFRAGDRVFVDVESVDRFKRQIDFHMADCAQPEPVRGEPQASGFKMGKVSRSGEPAGARKNPERAGKSPESARAEADDGDSALDCDKAAIPIPRGGGGDLCAFRGRIPKYSGTRKCFEQFFGDCSFS